MALYRATVLEGIKEWMLRQHYAPGLALDISGKLLNWRNREELYSIQRLIWNIQAVIYYQDILGWDNFCFVLVSINITAIQQYFLEDSGYKSLVEVWMSRAVINNWDIQKIMCNHRNIYVQESNRTIHQHKEEAINATRWWEFAVGQSGLPAAYSGLFTGKIQRLLKDDGTTKSQWIRYIWNVRDLVRIRSGLGG